ncbi:MAG TPA: hypothetical protein VFM84_07625 [Holophagaceae bacterium]|nr:hypothetical protein [Holophagaceae bacterium]
MATPSPDDPGSNQSPVDEAWHALLHDLRGCLGGVKATLDLRDPGVGLEARDSARVEAAVREGLALLELSRALAFGSWPDGACEGAEAWRRALEPDLSALAASFRGKASVAMTGEDLWPGALLRSFTLSLSRLLLPQALPDALALEADGQADAWILRFRPVLAPPLALQPQGAPKDLHGLWVREVSERCKMTADHAGDSLTLRIPRRPEGLPPVE